MDKWPADDRTTDDLTREATYFARIVAGEGRAIEIERLALPDPTDAADVGGDNGPDGMITRHHDRWAAQALGRAPDVAWSEGELHGAFTANRAGYRAGRRSGHALEDSRP